MPHVDIRDFSPRSPFDLSALVPQSHSTLLRRGLSPTSLAVAIIFPIIFVAFASGTITVIVMRRRRRRQFHQNSPTTSMVRGSLEEDLESYRQERQRMGDVVGVGVSAEDLQQQLRLQENRMSVSSSLTDSGSRRSSRHSPYGNERRPRTEIEGWYSPSPPAAARGPNRTPRGPSRAKSRPASNLRNSIQAEPSVAEKEIRGYYEPSPRSQP